MSNRPARYSALVRCLRLASLLTGRRRLPSVQMLAGEIGVCQRTVLRYLDALEEAQWPVPSRTVNDRKAV